jgi:hypothetical protein
VPNQRQRDLESSVARASAVQRAKIVKAVLQPGEELVADPAVSLCQQTAPTKSAMLGLAEEGFLFATDRRLLYRTPSGNVTVSWLYCEIADHRLGRCSETRLVCSLSAWSRLRGLGWGFATLRFTTADGHKFALHGSRPFLAAVASVLDGVDVDALPPMPTTTAVWSKSEQAVRCRACRGAVDERVVHCPSCGRQIDWNESRHLARRANDRHHRVARRH